ncbi:MAG: hypothetical protein ABWY78_07665 [Microvirga sp.]
MISSRIVLICVAVSATILPAAAQESGSTRPLTLTVRPSGRDTAPDEALARQERLLKRMAQNDFMFRSICISCGDAWKHNSYAPFNPMRSLHGNPNEPASEPGPAPILDASSPQP